MLSPLTPGLAICFVVCSHPLPRLIALAKGGFILCSECLLRMLRSVTHVCTYIHTYIRTYTRTHTHTRTRGIIYGLKFVNFAQSFEQLVYSFSLEH